MSFSFTQRVGGRKVGRKFVGKARNNARRKSCIRTVTAGALSFSGHSGINRVVFQLGPLNGVSFANSESLRHIPAREGKDRATLESSDLQSVSRLRLAGASSPPILLAAPGAARDAVLTHDKRRSCAGRSARGS